MASKKTAEPKVILERDYIIPLRREWLKVPEYKRGKKAVKAIKQFLVRHMKVYDRDLRKIKIDVTLNNELRFRGIRKPPAKIKVKAKKFDNDEVFVELVDVPAYVKFKKAKEEKAKLKIKPTEKKKEEVKKVEEKPAETVEAKEKEEAAKEETLKIAKEQARERKHVSKVKEEKIHRKALSR